MKAKSAFAFVLLVVGVMVAGAHTVYAQATSMTVRVARPGEGETIYISPDAPFAHVPVTGWVSADDFAVTQLRVELEIIRGTQTSVTMTTAPNAAGQFTFDIGINLNSQWSHAVTECQGSVCHNNAPVGFPPGAVLLRVSAIDPLGRRAVADRSVIVDHSSYAHIPVQVLLADSQEPVGAGLRVVADTRLYEWRSRQYDAKTDANGRAQVDVEALGQARTRYVFSVEPAVLDGVIYKGRESVQVTLAPGATTGGPVTLRVTSERGQITGSISPEDRVASDLIVHAIALPGGATYAARATSARFSLVGLPIGKYLLAADGGQAAPQTIDLSANPAVSLTVQVPEPARSVHGLVHDGAGKPLPFAWIATDEDGQVGRVSPSSGEFVLANVPSGTRALWVTAPGYWRRPVARANPLDVQMTALSDTRSIPWGTGAITLPAQTLAEVSPNRLLLKRGWMWGEGSGAFSVSTSDLDVALQGGSFALEYLPGETNWLYVMTGQAQVVASSRDEPVAVGAGQMLASGRGVTRPAPVALDPAAVQALHAGETIPVREQSDSAFPARIRDAVEQQGVSFVQAMIVAALGVALLAVGGIARSLRRRGQPF